MSFDLELINNDLAIKQDGKIRTLTDTPKLRQDILKIILTVLGSVRFHKWYGCAISETIGKQMSDTFKYSVIQGNMAQSLQRLKALQVAQSSNQKVTLAELIEQIGEIHVERDITDARKMNIVVTILSKRLSKIEELFTLIS